MSTMGTTENAAASGMLPAVPCCTYTIMPMKYPGAPTTLGMMKSPSVSENVNTDPAAMPGTASGSITLRKVCEGRAPRSAEACSSEPGTRSSAAAMGRIMNGSHMYTNTMNMPMYEDDNEGPPM